MVHFGDEIGKHAFSLLTLSLEVFHNAPLAFGEDDVNGDGVLLPKPPATTDRLVVLLEAMGGEVGDMTALLKVEAPCANLGLCDQHAGAAFCEVNQPLFLEVVTIGSRYLN